MRSYPTITSLPDNCTRRSNQHDNNNMPYIHEITNQDVLLLNREEFITKFKFSEFLLHDLQFEGSGEVLNLDTEDVVEFSTVASIFQDLTNSDLTTPDLTTVRQTATVLNVGESTVGELTTQELTTQKIDEHFDLLENFYDYAIIIAPIVLFITFFGFSLYAILKYKKYRKDTGKYNPQDIEKKIGISEIGQKFGELQNLGQQNTGFETRYDRGLIRFLQLPVEEKLI